MGELTVTPWNRYGKHRLYVNDGSGATLGWYDLDTGAMQVSDATRMGDVSEVLAAHLGGQARPEAGQASISAPAPEPSEELTDVPALTDLASRRPGEAVRVRAREEWTSRKESSKLLAYLGRALDVHTDERAWRRGAEGEEAVGEVLRKLESRGWLALHSVPVGKGESDIDHVVIGPGGVFTLNTKNHRGKRVGVNPRGVFVSGHWQPYVRNSRHEADRASRLLTAACGFPVLVRGVIVIFAEEFSVKRRPDEVTVLRSTELRTWLKKRPEVLDAQTVKAIFAQARWAETWRP